MLTRSPGDDGGFTLVELLVVMVVTAVVGTMVTSAVVASVRAAARSSVRVEALNELRPATDRLTRDLRAADPLVLDAGGAYDTRVGVQVVRAGTTYRHTYYLQGSAGDWTLWQDRVRVEADGSETVLATRALVAEVDNDAAQPVFTYVDADGDPITCQATAVTAAELAACRDEHLTAARVDVHVVRAVDGGRPVEFASAVTIRNARYG